MLNRNQVIAVLLLSMGLLSASCGHATYNGEDFINYPDLEKILLQEVDMEQPYSYLKVSYRGDQKDSSQVSFSDMPWAELKAIFKKANLHNKELNHMYSIDIMYDTLANTRTLYFNALSPKVITRSLSIISDVFDNKIRNVYFETLDRGLLSTEYYKILLTPDEIIQIQKKVTSKVSKDESNIDMYYYP